MPESDLKVSAVALNIIQGETVANLHNAEAILTNIGHDCDLIVWPELFTSGFKDDPEWIERITESAESTESWIHAAAYEYGCAMAGSFLAKNRSGQPVNRGFIALPGEARLHTYDKAHLFILGGESRLLKAGKEISRPVVFRGWNLKLSICYDIRFPVWNRRCKGCDYDLLVVPANWAHSRSYAWTHMLIARAIENQVYVVGANRSGVDHYGEYPPQDSEIYDNWGKPVGIHSDDIIVSATLDANGLNTSRSRFPVWENTDSFTLD